MIWTPTGPIACDTLTCTTGEVLTYTGSGTQWITIDMPNDLKTKLLEKVLDGTFTVEEAKKINEHLCK